MLLKREDSPVASGNGAIEPVPQLVEMPHGRCQRREHLNRVVLRVGRSGATFKAVVGSKVAVRPEVERISVPAIAKHGIGTCHHSFRVLEGLVLIYDSRRLVVEIIVTACKCKAQAY